MDKKIMAESVEDTKENQETVLPDDDDDIVEPTMQVSEPGPSTADCVEPIPPTVAVVPAAADPAAPILPSDDPTPKLVPIKPLPPNDPIVSEDPRGTKRTLDTIETGVEEKKQKISSEDTTKLSENLCTLMVMQETSKASDNAQKFFFTKNIEDYEALMKKKDPIPSTSSVAESKRKFDEVQENVENDGIKKMRTEENAAMKHSENYTTELQNNESADVESRISQCSSTISNLDSNDSRDDITLACSSQLDDSFSDSSEFDIYDVEKNMERLFKSIESSPDSHKHSVVTSDFDSEELDKNLKLLFKSSESSSFGTESDETYFSSDSGTIDTDEDGSRDLVYSDISISTEEKDMIEHSKTIESATTETISDDSSSSVKRTDDDSSINSEENDTKEHSKSSESTSTETKSEDSSSSSDSPLRSIVTDEDAFGDCVSSDHSSKTGSKDKEILTTSSVSTSTETKSDDSSASSNSPSRTIVTDNDSGDNESSDHSNNTKKETLTTSRESATVGNKSDDTSSTSDSPKRTDEKDKEI